MSLVTEWQVAKQQFDYYKKQELELRNQIISQHTKALKTQGVTRVTQDNVPLKVTTRVNVRPDPSRYETLNAESVFPKDYIKESDYCILWKPAVSQTIYKQLSDEDRFEADKYLIVKPGQASFSIEGEE